MATIQKLLLSANCFVVCLPQWAIDAAAASAAKWNISDMQNTPVIVASTITQEYFACH